MEQRQFIDLLTLQECIKEEIGSLEAWIKVELDSVSCSGGHYYLGLIQKSPQGKELAKARAIIWRSHADLVAYFKHESGKELAAGMELLMMVSVNYDARFGLSLIVNDIDADFTIGQREAEKQRTIKALKDNGLLERQGQISLPYLPRHIAVISSSTAAGYGDFMKQLSQNQYGFVFNTTLFDSVMQGDSSPKSIIESIAQICEEDQSYDLVLILRGGGAESDMFCFDDYGMCEAIASCPIPVLTAIGHERDFHIADMVACEHLKTPTALAAFLVDWVASVEAEVERCAATIRFALSSAISAMNSNVDLLEARIKAADPRSILSQGYVLATDSKGRVIKSAAKGRAGEEFSLSFKDGKWECRINEIKRN